MERKISDIKARILEFAEHQGLKKNRVAQLMGLSYHSFRGPALSSPPNAQGIQTLLRAFPQLSADWLLLGREPILRTISEERHPGNPKEPENPNRSLDIHALIGAIDSLVEALTDANNLSEDARLAYKRLAEAEHAIGELKVQLVKTEAQLAEAKRQLRRPFRECKLDAHEARS